MLKRTYPVLSGFVSALVLLSVLSLLAPVRSTGQNVPSPPAESPAPPLVTPPPQELAIFMQQGVASENQKDYAVAEKSFRDGLDKARGLRNLYYEGRFLNALGTVCADMKRFKEALPFFKQSYAIRKNLPDKADLVQTLVNLSHVYSDLSETQNALDYADKAMKLLPYVVRKGDFISHLLVLSDIYIAAKKPLKAIDCYNNIIKILTEPREKTDIAAMQSRIGNAYSSMEQFSKAAEIFEQAVKTSEAAGDKKRESAILISLGDVYNKAGEPQKALDRHLKSLKIRQDAHDQPMIAQSLRWVGMDYNDQADTKNALKYNTQALEAVTTLKSPSDIIGALITLGSTYTLMADTSHALELFTQALDLLKITPNETAQANVLMGMGRIYFLSGQYTDYLRVNEQALSVFQHLHHPEGVSKCRLNMGFAELVMGKYATAQAYLDPALIYFKKQTDKRDYAGCLNLQAQINFRQNRITEAQGCASDALEIYLKYDAKLDCAIAYNTLALCVGNQHDFSKAFDLEQKAWEKAKDAGNAQFNGIILMNLGKFRLEQDRAHLEEARHYSSQALDILRPLANQDSLAVVQNNIAASYAEDNDYENALTWARNAAAAADKSGNPITIALCYRSLGGAYGGLNRYEEAVPCFERAITIYESEAEQISDPAGLAAFQDGQERLYEQYSSLLGIMKRPEDALLMVERGRAQAARRNIALLQTDYTRYLTPKEAAELKQKNKELLDARYQAEEIQSRRETAPANQKDDLDKQAECWQGKRNQAAQEVAALRDSLYVAHPQFRQIMENNSLTAADLNTLTQANPDTLFIEWAMVDDENTMLFTLSKKDGCHFFALSVGEADLSKKAEEWRQRILATKSNDAKALANEKNGSRDFYNALFEPLTKAGLMKPGRYHRLVFVGSGPTLRVPMAALMTAKGHRLTDDYEISSALSLDLLRPSETPAKATASLLCVADSTGDNGKNAAVRGGHGALPASRKEVKRIAQLVHGAVVRQGKAARKSVVLSGIGRYLLLHFAVHGEPAYGNGNNLLSYLVLAPEANSGVAEAHLEAREIMNLPLSARLITLSACSSDPEKAAGGEGLFGVAWAFRAAGCPSVVASQWQVDDKATLPLMTEFYKNLKKPGAHKDAALRDAMRTTRKKYPAPCYWAAFQLIGDASPIHW